MESILVRPMTEADADRVRRADRVAFAPYRQTHGQDPSLARTREVVLWNLAKDPEGCFVAEVDGRFAGHVFSRRWGAVGWTGALGVLPAYQGLGVGRALLRRSREHLLAGGCRYVGLETMPDSAANIGLYLSEGYRVDRFTLGWIKSLDSGTGPTTPSSVRKAVAGRSAERGTRTATMSSSWATGEDGSNWLSALAELADAVLPGLEFGPEAHLLLEHGLGDVLLLRERGVLVAAAALRLARMTAPDGPVAHPPPVSTEFLLLGPGATPEAVLAEVERRVSGLGRTTFSLVAECRAVGGHSHDLGPEADFESVLSRRGYRVSMTSLRLLATGCPSLAGAICWRWAG
jgi:ribosomal protein S18 acetylase RimI-like enzyme